MEQAIGMKVKEIMELNVLKNARLVSGGQGMDKLVSKVNVMEVPDILNWVKPGELLLTVGFSIKDNVERLNDLIPRLVDIGVTGIGIKVNRYIKAIPESVIDTSNRLSFPIIEIPYDVSFADIITPVLSEIVNEQTRTLRQINEFNNRLTKAMLKGGSLVDIANTINDIIDVPVAIIEDVFKTNYIACYEKNYDDINRISEDILNHTCSFDVSRDKKLKRYVDCVNGVEMNRIMIPVDSEERHYGFIVIWEAGRELSKIELSIIESSTSFVALDLMKKLSVFENENKHRIEFFDDLLSDDDARQKKAIEKSSYFDFDKDKSHSVIIVAINEADKQVKMTPNNTNYFQYLSGKIISIAERLSRQYKGRVQFGNKSDRMIILFNSDKDKSDIVQKKEIVNFSKEILNYAEIESIANNVSVGIGRNYRDYSDLHKSYREAKRAVENMILSNSYKIPVHYDDLGIYRILSYEELQPELYQFYMETLEPLVRYDKDKDSELVETLRMYFECGSNLKKVSEEMYTHYNTVIYRMQRIKDIIGIDLDDPNSRLNLQIAVKILDIIKTDFSIR